MPSFWLKNLSQNLIKPILPQQKPLWEHVKFLLITSKPDLLASKRKSFILDFQMDCHIQIAQKKSKSSNKSQLSNEEQKESWLIKRFILE